MVVEGSVGFVGDLVRVVLGVVEADERLEGVLLELRKSGRGEREGKRRKKGKRGVKKDGRGRDATNT